MTDKRQLRVALMVLLVGGLSVTPVWSADAPDPTPQSNQCCYSDQDMDQVDMLQQTLEWYGIHSRRLATASEQGMSWSLWVDNNEVQRSRDIVESVLESEMGTGSGSTASMGGCGCGQL